MINLEKTKDKIAELKSTIVAEELEIKATKGKIQDAENCMVNISDPDKVDAVFAECQDNIDLFNRDLKRAEIKLSAYKATLANLEDDLAEKIEANRLEVRASYEEKVIEAVKSFNEASKVMAGEFDNVAALLAEAHPKVYKVGTNWRFHPEPKVYGKNDIKALVFDKRKSEIQSIRYKDLDRNVSTRKENSYEV